MARTTLVVFSARGERTFSAVQKGRLSSVAEVRFVVAPETLSRDAFLRAAAGAVVAGLSPRATPLLDAALLSELPFLRAVALPTTGTEWLSVEALEKHGVRVRNLPGFSTESTAEFAWTLILASVRKLPEAQRQMETGRTGASLVGFELRGKTLGIAGAGAVGKRVGEIGRAFGMRVLAFDRVPPSVDLDTLFAESDIVSLHLPLTDETRALVDERRLRRLASHAVLVNTARPALVSLPAVVAALDEGRFARYAFDAGYFRREELLPWISHPRVLAVPHVSWYTNEAIAREIDGWVETLVAVCDAELSR